MAGAAFLLLAQRGTSRIDSKTKAIVAGMKQAAVSNVFNGL